MVNPMNTTAMKKLTFLAGAALVCALVCPGCSGDVFDEMNGAPDAGNPDTPALGEGIRTLTVGMAELGAPGTRASFGDEAGGKLPVFWDAEDRIVAYETVGEHAAGHAYKLVGPGGSCSGTFAYDGGQTPPSAIAEIYYPAELAGTNFAVPAVQTYTPGSFDPAAHVMRAEVGNPGEPIVFGSLVSVACLRLPSADGRRRKGDFGASGPDAFGRGDGELHAFVSRRRDAFCGGVGILHCGRRLGNSLRRRLYRLRGRGGDDGSEDHLRQDLRSFHRGAPSGGRLSAESLSDSGLLAR